MAKQRSGYVYEEITWYAAVTYTQSGKPQKVKRRAKGQTHAKQLADEMALDLKQQLGPKIKLSKSTVSESAGWYARVTYTDESGKRKNVKQRAENKSAAKETVKNIIRDLDDNGERSRDAARMTFAQLADYYKENYLIEPEYVDGRKVAGLRSYYGVSIRLQMLKDYFGKFKLRSLTHGDLKRFKTHRLKTPTRTGFHVLIVFTDSKQNRREERYKSQKLEQAEAVASRVVERLSKRKGISIVEKRIEAKPGGQRSITTVNRELQVLRRALNVALSNGWIRQNPFEMGDALITPGDERKRERILTRSEEERLLTACVGRRAHMRSLIICALDTGMRKGEMLKLLPSDLDFENLVINVRAFNTKTMRERQVAMSKRLALELEFLCAELPPGEDMPVFGIKNDFKKAFDSVRKETGLQDLRFHDLRHTHATRLVTAHMPLSEVGRVLGHTQANTTFRYVNANVETARRAAALIDEFNAERPETIIN